jgi:DNA invertase Pin-like site-specific DNA recombinase
VSECSSGLQGQHRELEHWAKSQAEPVQWFRDKFTGKAMNRPGFDQLMNLVRQGKVSKIMVWRLGRSWIPRGRRGWDRRGRDLDGSGNRSRQV